MGVDSFHQPQNTAEILARSVWQSAGCALGGNRDCLSARGCVYSILLALGIPTLFVIMSPYPVQRFCGPTVLC